ncbi:MAG: hypothetical protein WCQ95_13020 [Bacteroidota bacterium]
MTDDTKPNVKIIDAENLEVDYNFEITHYNMDENGNYSHGLLANWGGKELTNTQSWEIVKERIRDAKEKVLREEISPIAYYMEKCLTDVSTLSKYIGISKWRLKRHLKPKIFKKMNPKMLQHYADFFYVTIEELKDIELNKK